MPLRDPRPSLFDRAENTLMHEDDGTGGQTYDHSNKRGNRFVRNR